MAQLCYINQYVLGQRLKTIITTTNNLTDTIFWYLLYFSITVAMYCLRFMQTFFVEKNIGPKVIMIKNMVSFINCSFLSHAWLFSVIFCNHFEYLFITHFWPLWRGWKKRMITQNRQKSNAKKKIFLHFWYYNSRIAIQNTHNISMCSLVLWILNSFINNFINMFSSNTLCHYACIHGYNKKQQSLF